MNTGKEDSKTAKIHEFEFGGPIGVSALMIWSHYIVLYFWLVRNLNIFILLINKFRS
jgi:hypothetical protein